MIFFGIAAVAAIMVIWYDLRIIFELCKDEDGDANETCHVAKTRH